MLFLLCLSVQVLLSSEFFSVPTETFKPHCRAHVFPHHHVSVRLLWILVMWPAAPIRYFNIVHFITYFQFLGLNTNKMFLFLYFFRTSSYSVPAFQLLRLYASGQSISVWPPLQTPTSVNSLLLIRHLTPGRQRAASLSSFPVWLCILGVASDFSHKYSKVTLILSLVIKSKVFPCVNFLLYFFCLFVVFFQIYMQ